MNEERKIYTNQTNSEIYVDEVLTDYEILIRQQESINQIFDIVKHQEDFIRYLRYGFIFMFILVLVMLFIFIVIVINL